MPPYWRTLGPFLVAYSEIIVGCMEILGIESAVSDCAADYSGDGAKKESSCRSEEEEGS